jgi:acid phosphatase (class A)
MKNRSTLFVVLAVLVYAALATGCASSCRLNQPAAVPEIRQGALAGYLPPTALPNSLSLILPPPAAGSAALANDEEASRKGLALRGTPRWRLAIEDADVRQAAGTFSCAVNAPITEQETPRLYMLMRRASTDAGRSTSAAKDYYRRSRPFMVNNEPICTPGEEEFLRKNGSYPSGHAAIGWALALILTEIAPERTDAILARGLAFGESRVICNVHWQSDVVEGRLMGAGTVARLHADAAFRAELEAASAEFAALRAKGLKPQRDCAAEAATLAK